MTFIILLVGGLILFIVIVYIISVWNNTRAIDLESMQDEEEQLLQQIEQLSRQLTEQREQLKNNHVNKIVNLPQATNNVLDIYERSNIKIPLDIIESLSYETFNNESDVFNYIENQRNYWKLENTKKPYKRG